MSILNNLIRDKIFPALAHQLATSVLFLPKNKNKREKIIISEWGGGRVTLDCYNSRNMSESDITKCVFYKTKIRVHYLFTLDIFILKRQKKSLYLRVEKTSDVKSTQIAHSILFQPR